MSDRTHLQLGRGLGLLTTNNSKVLKGGAKGFATAILHLAPAWESRHNTCAKHTKECAAACLYTTSWGAMAKVKEARVRRTKMFFEDRVGFLGLLHKDIERFVANANRLGMVPAVRLNGTSDIRWEVYGVPQKWGSLTFYDYTKLEQRKNLPPNYHLTFSFSGHNLEACRAALANGMNVAVPFAKVPPRTWLGYPTIDGDEDDLRFLNGGPHIIALKVKGRLRSQLDSPFIGDNHPALCA